MQKHARLKLIKTKLGRLRTGHKTIMSAHATLFTVTNPSPTTPLFVRPQSDFFYLR